MKTFKELVESHSDIKESGKNYLVKFDTFGKPVTVGIDKSLPSVYITSKIDTLFDEIKQDVKDRIDENLEEKQLEKEDIEKIMKAMGIENYKLIVTGKQLAKKWKTLRETLKQYDERITK